MGWMIDDRERDRERERIKIWLTHMTVEAKKSHDPQTGNPGKLKAYFQSKSKSLRRKRVDDVYFNLCPEAGEDWCPSSKTARMNSHPFCAISAFNRRDKAPILRGQSAWLSLLVQMLISVGNTLRNTLWIIVNQISEHLMVQSGWHIKLTIAGAKLPV